MFLRHRRRAAVAWLLAAGAAGAAGQDAPIVSPEVHPDRRVTFRFRAPHAKEVVLDREGAPPQPLRRDDAGVWTLTTGALDPDLYGYSFVADGVSLIDPSHPVHKPNLFHTQSLLLVPGPAPEPWEAQDVPRGTLHRHFYRSAVIGDDRDFYVYTPPGYDARGGRRYPVLYLLHGFSDDASGWTAVGRAHVILDNLIAAGRAKPMIVVMPLGYGAPEILTGGWSGIRDAAIRRRNADKFREGLLREVIPAVERDYRVDAGRAARAVAGLSMGGAQALLTGLGDLGRFAWVGAFSAAPLDGFEAAFPKLDEQGARLRLLWIACGRDDRLVESQRRLVGWLKDKQVRHTAVETPGGHTWMLWRRNLADFAALLFR